MRSKTVEYYSMFDNDGKEEGKGGQQQRTILVAKNKLAMRSNRCRCSHMELGVDGLCCNKTCRHGSHCHNLPDPRFITAV